MIAAHQTMLAPPALPYDAEVEYLECANTTSIIDTGWGMTSGTTFEIDALFVHAPSANHWAFGCRKSGSAEQCGMISFSDTRTRWAFGTKSYDSTKTFATGTRHTYSNTAQQNVLVCDSVGSISVSGAGNSFPSAIHFGLFSAYAPDQDSSYPGNRIYGAKLYGGVLVRDFQPVRVGSGAGAVGYLYDRVSGQLFGNAGTGAFTIGPDKT